MFLTSVFFFGKIVDPYLNTDAGTMSPFEHGEVFVLDDGGEVSSFLSVTDLYFFLKLQSGNQSNTFNFRMHIGWKV